MGRDPDSTCTGPALRPYVSWGMLAADIRAMTAMATGGGFGVGIGQAPLRGLDIRMVLPALAVALAIAALWWILIDRLDREEELLDETAYQKTEVMARLVEEHAMATIRRVDDLLLEVVERSGQSAAIRLSSRRAFEEGLVAAIRVYDADGMLKMGSGRSAYRAAILDRDEFRGQQAAGRNATIIGLPYVAPDSPPASRDTLIPISRRLEDGDGRFAGVAVADVPVEAFLRFYGVLGLPPGASIALLRADGNILARHALPDHGAGRSLAPDRLWGALAERPEGRLRAVSPVDGVERVLAYRTTAGYPLVVVVGEAVDTIFGPSRANARLYIGWAGAATLVILLFTAAFVVEMHWRRRIDRALRVRNRAMEWSGDGILIADATRPGMPIVYGNPSADRLLGSSGEPPSEEPSSHEPLAGQGVIGVLERAVPDPAVLRPLAMAVDVGREERVEFRHARLPDTHLELRASPVRNERGHLVNLIAIVRDISEHKRAQAELAEARREADRANVAKSKFLAAASHDLRQPVQSLMLLMEVLSARTGDPTTKSVLATMDRALDGLKMLLDGLLDVSRLEAGAIEAKPVIFPVNEMLERVGAGSRPVAVRKGLLLHIVPSRAHVRSDPMLLGRILQNLVENALRYTESGRVLVGCRRTAGMLRIEVWDTGIGIPPDRQEDIFQEFVQVGNAGRNRDQGLGLGLAVVRRLSGMLGHRVTLRSTPGRGSVFAVEVPLAEAPALPSPVSPPPPAPPAPSTVLIIEDDGIVREGLRCMVEEWGYNVLAAESCAEALQLIEGGPVPEIIVADYRLRGGRTGTEAIGEVRAVLKREVPAVLVTGDTAPARAKEAAAGRYRVLHKPVAPLDLKRAIVTAIGGRPVQRVPATD